MNFFKKILKISLIVILAVTIIYLIVGLFFLNDNKSSSKYGGFGSVVAPGSRSASSTGSTDELDVNLDKILINLRSGQYEYMKADMTFHMNDENQKERLIQNMPRVRDAILQFSASQDSDKLSTPAGKEEYKKSVQDLLYKEFGYKIDAVYFRNFVLAP